MGGRCRRCAIGALVVGAGAVVLRKPGVRARARRARDDARRRVHFLEGRADGWFYRTGMGGPDPDAPDDVVADRVRTALGPVVRSRDLPHVHVFVERRVAVLHGDVGTPEDRAAIEDVTLGVPGVAGMESHLHVGLLPSDTRPSQGHQPSSGLTTLVDTAARHGGGEVTALVAVKAVLGTFASMLPAAERARLASHLPTDVRELLEAPQRAGVLRHVDTVDQLLRAVTATGLVSPTHAPWIVESVLSALHDMVPEEAEAVAALLPPGVRGLWEAPAAEVPTS